MPGALKIFIRGSGVRALLALYFLLTLTGRIVHNRCLLFGIGSFSSSTKMHKTAELARGDHIWAHFGHLDNGTSIGILSWGRLKKGMRVKNMRIILKPWILENGHNIVHYPENLRIFSYNN